MKRPPTSPLTEPHPPVLAVTCLAFESRIAAGAGVHVLCKPNIRRLRSSIEAAIVSTGCCGLVSFGVAGGLDPARCAGDWIVASSIVSEAGRFFADAAWSRTLLAALPGAIHADISGVDAPLATRGAKLLLRRQHRSAAVDTESHIAAGAAARAGVPFAALRVVLDPAWQGLPPAALLPLRTDGRPNVGAVFRSLWRTPAQIGDLLKVTADASRALMALLEARKRLGDRLGYAGTFSAQDELRACAPVPGLIANCADAPA